MSTSTSGIHRYRWALPTPRTPTRQFRDFLQRPFFWQRLLVALAAILLMFLVARGWESAFPYRIRQIPQRKLAAYIEFEVQDREATREAIAKAKSKIACLYENDLRLLEEVRQALIDEVFQVKDKPLEELESTAWPRFYPVSQVTPGAPAANVEPDKRRAELEQFKAALKADERLESLRGVLTRAFLEIDATGLLESLEHDLTRGSMLEIQVYRKGDPETTRTVEVSKVRIAEAADVLRKNLTRELEKENATFPESALLAERLYQWLRPRLPVTLKWNDEASRRESEAAGKKVETKLRLYKVGDPLQHANLTGEKPEHLGGQPLVAADLELLEAEHQAAQSQTKWYSTFARSLLFFLSVGLAIGLVAAFLWKQQPQLLTKCVILAVLGSGRLGTLGQQALLENTQNLGELLTRAARCPFDLFANVAALRIGTACGGLQSFQQFGTDGCQVLPHRPSGMLAHQGPHHQQQVREQESQQHPLPDFAHARSPRDTALALSGVTSSPRVR